MVTMSVFKMAGNVEALAKKGNLKDKSSAFAPKFNSSTNVQFTTSSPFFANAMLYAVFFGVTSKNKFINEIII